MKRNTGGSILRVWLNASVKYDKLKNDEEKRPATMIMGITSIVYSVVSLIIFALFAWGFCACVSAMAGGTAFILPLVGCIIMGACAVAVLLFGYVSALLYMIYQLRLNKRPIGYVALAVWLASVIAGAVCFILFYLFIAG